MDIDILGSYNTLKATLPSLVKSAAKNKSDGKSREQYLPLDLSTTDSWLRKPLQVQAGV